MNTVSVPEKLRLKAIHPLDRYLGGPVLSIGSHRMRTISTGSVMESGRPRGLAALLTLALSAGTVAGAGPLGSPAWADDAPAGTFSLDSTDIWTAQQVTLTQTALVDPTPETPLARIVDWGDDTGPQP